MSGMPTETHVSFNYLTTVADLLPLAHNLKVWLRPKPLWLFLLALDYLYALCSDSSVLIHHWIKYQANSFHFTFGQIGRKQYT
jgi:hypothetical protein